MPFTFSYFLAIKISPDVVLLFSYIRGRFVYFQFLLVEFRGALVAYASVDASPYQSGTFDAKKRHVSKRGSPNLRNVLFEISSGIFMRENRENPIFCFMDKKRAEGKHYYVYTVAGAAKFLRIYYAKVKEYLNVRESL